MVEWIAINTISNIILVFALVIVTWYYTMQAKKQTEFMKIDRLVREMDMLISPLYNRIGDKIIFQKGAQSNIDSTRPRDQEYLKFWDDVKRNKYLAPDYLRSAINNYLENKSDSITKPERDESYIIAEDKLFKEINNRYKELENELSILIKKM